MMMLVVVLVVVFMMMFVVVFMMMLMLTTTCLLVMIFFCHIATLLKFHGAKVRIRFCNLVAMFTSVAGVFVAGPEALG